MFSPLFFFFSQQRLDVIHCLKVQGGEGKGVSPFFRTYIGYVPQEKF